MTAKQYQQGTVDHRKGATLSAVVARVNNGRSVELRLLSCNAWMVIGNVTIPPKHPMPVVGNVVGVHYLAVRENQSLQKPSYLGLRKHIQPHECIMAQPKFSPTRERQGRGVFEAL